MKKCIYCNKVAEKRHMCQTHYRAWWKANNPEKDKQIRDRYEKGKSEANKKLRVCVACSTEFRNRNNNAKYCSLKCRETEYLKKKKASYDPLKKRSYYLNNRSNINEKKAAYKRDKRHKDDNYRLKCNLRSRLNKAVQLNYRSGSAVRDLGCSIEELKKHLESQFQPGMTWDNYGRDGWHIDHIKPLASFDLSNPEQFKEACNYTNLQPLWAEDNILKSSSHTKE